MILVEGDVSPKLLGHASLREPHEESKATTKKHVSKIPKNFFILFILLQNALSSKRFTLIC
jgi:hypothetical protein